VNCLTDPKKSLVDFIILHASMEYFPIVAFSRGKFGDADSAEVYVCQVLG
jgi:hypothetical protein